MVFVGVGEHVGLVGLALYPHGAERGDRLVTVDTTSQDTLGVLIGFYEVGQQEAHSVEN